MAVTVEAAGGGGDGGATVGGPDEWQPAMSNASFPRFDCYYPSVIRYAHAAPI